MFNVKIIGNYLKTIELTSDRERYVHTVYNNAGKVVWRTMYLKTDEYDANLFSSVSIVLVFLHSIKKIYI